MNPTKRKEISKLTADKLGRDFAQVDEIATFFYRYVQKKMSSMEHNAVYVPNLGTFSVKKRRLQTKIDKSENILASIDDTTSIRAFEIKQTIKKDLEKYNAIMDVILSEEERKQKVRKLQREQEDDAD